MVIILFTGFIFAFEGMFMYAKRFVLVFNLLIFLLVCEMNTKLDRLILGFKGVAG